MGILTKFERIGDEHPYFLHETGGFCPKPQTNVFGPFAAEDGAIGQSGAPVMPFFARPA